MEKTLKEAVEALKGMHSNCFYEYYLKIRTFIMGTQTPLFPRGIHFEGV